MKDFQEFRGIHGGLPQFVKDLVFIFSCGVLSVLGDEVNNILHYLNIFIPLTGSSPMIFAVPPSVMSFLRRSYAFSDLPTVNRPCNLSEGPCVLLSCGHSR